MRKYISLAIILFWITVASVAWADCNATGSLVPDLDPQKSAGCIARIQADLIGKKELDKERIHEFIIDLLDADMDSLTFMNGKISSIISLLKSTSLMNAYADYIVRLDYSKLRGIQVRQEALAKLFVLETPLMLEVIHSKNTIDKDILIDNLAFGINSFFYPHINEENFQRKMVGEYWELLQSPANPKLQAQIETAIRGVITGEKVRLYDKALQRTSR